VVVHPIVFVIDLVVRLVEVLRYSQVAAPKEVSNHIRTTPEDSIREDPQTSLVSFSCPSSAALVTGLFQFFKTFGGGK
jgi:hypothetical protein